MAEYDLEGTRNLVNEIPEPWDVLEVMPHHPEGSQGSVIIGYSFSGLGFDPASLKQAVIQAKNEIHQATVGNPNHIEIIGTHLGINPTEESALYDVGVIVALPVRGSLFESLPLMQEIIINNITPAAKPLEPEL